MRLFLSVGSILDRLCIVAGAFFGSQCPPFMQQYTQRLAGHVAELQQLLDQLRQAAALSHKTLDQYILKFISSTDPDFAQQGKFMQGIFHRWEELNQALVHLNQSSVWMRPYAFFRDIQTDIVQSTMSVFQPGMNLSLEGLCYAGMGMFFGWVSFRLVSKVIRALGGLLRRPLQQESCLNDEWSYHL